MNYTAVQSLTYFNAVYYTLKMLKKSKIIINNDIENHIINNEKITFSVSYKSGKNEGEFDGVRGVTIAEEKIFLFYSGNNHIQSLILKQVNFYQHLKYQNHGE